MIAPPFTKRRQETCAEWLASLTDEEVCKRLRVGGGKDGFYGSERAWIEEHRLETPQTAATAPKEVPPPAGPPADETERQEATDALQADVAEASPLDVLRAIAADLAARSAAGALPVQEVARFRARCMREGVTVEAAGITIDGKTGAIRSVG